MAISTAVQEQVGECKVILVTLTDDNEVEAPFEAFDVWCEKCQAFPAVLVSETEAMTEATEHDCYEWDGSVA